MHLKKWKQYCKSLPILSSTLFKVTTVNTIQHPDIGTKKDYVCYRLNGSRDCFHVTKRLSYLEN